MDQSVQKLRIKFEGTREHLREGGTVEGRELEADPAQELPAAVAQHARGRAPAPSSA